MISDQTQAPKIGEIMPDGHAHAGWIYMGPDDETGKDFYLSQKDEKFPYTNFNTYNFNQAAERTTSMGAQIPTNSQWQKIIRYRDCGALAKTFNLSGTTATGGSYWSSSVYNNSHAWSIRPSDGRSCVMYKEYALSLRCVRS